MDKFIFNYITKLDPFAQPEDVHEAYFVNNFDLFVRFKDGRKFMYDTYHDYFSGFYPEGYMLSDEELRRSFNKRLRQNMSRNKVSQEELARCIGVSERTISRYVNDETIPDALTLKKISLALNCDMNDFFYEEY